MGGVTPGLSDKGRSSPFSPSARVANQRLSSLIATALTGFLWSRNVFNAFAGSEMVKSHSRTAPSSLPPANHLRSRLIAQRVFAWPTVGETGEPFGKPEALISEKMIAPPSLAAINHRWFALIATKSIPVESRRNRIESFAGSARVRSQTREVLSSLPVA